MAMLLTSLIADAARGIRIRVVLGALSAALVSPLAVAVAGDATAIAPLTHPAHDR